MNDNELITVDDRVYVSPDVSLQETNEFINNLRQTQQSGVAEIEQQTRDLGSDLPPSQGGLGGASGAFVSRYQTPVVSAAVADLRTAAQASALNTLLQNEISQKKKAYNDAYKAAKKRAADRASRGNNTTNPGNNTQPDVVTEEPESGFGQGKIRSEGAGTTVIANGTYDPTTGKPGYDVIDSATGKTIKRVYGDGTVDKSIGSSSSGKKVAGLPSKYFNTNL